MTARPIKIPELYTKYLFVTLLRSLACDLILDVGSRDGQESLIFAHQCPDVRIVAFEANPENAARMLRDPDFQRAGVSRLSHGPGASGVPAAENRHDAFGSDSLPHIGG
jgi:predicted O-methyltransferase YrrM